MKSIDERIEEKGFWYDSNDNCCVDYTSVVELVEEQKQNDIEDIFSHVENFLRNNMLSHIVKIDGKVILNMETLMLKMKEDYTSPTRYTAKGTYTMKGGEQ